MQLANGRILEQNAVFQRRDLILKDGVVAQITDPYSKSREEVVIDAEGGYVLPGLIDLNCFGGGGTEFARTDPDGRRRLAAWLASQGVTGYVGTVAMPARQMEEVLDETRPLYRQDTGGAVLQGIRLEGPFLSAARAGGLDENNFSEPDPLLFDCLAERAGDALKLMTISPERKGASGLIRHAAARCRVAVGHTGAAYDQARIAFALGAKQVQLFEDVPAFTPKEPGVLAAAAESNVYAELAPDAARLHPATVRMAFQLFGPDRMCLVSGYTAGAFFSLTDCLRTAVWFGVPLPYAVRAATVNPAKALGIYDRVGSLEEGKRADAVVLDLHDLSLRTVILNGEVIIHNGKHKDLGG